jgi:class 3 adenylate cyclase
MSAKYYKKNARLPTIIPSFLSFYFALFGQILHPINLQTSVECLSREIWDPAVPFAAVNLFVLALVVIINLLFFHVFLNIVTQTLLFRPMSLLSTSNLPQKSFFAVSTICCVLMALSAHAALIPMIVINVIVAIIYFGSARIPFVCGGFVSLTIATAVISTSIASGVIVLIVTGSAVVGRKGSMGFLFLFVSLHVLSYIFSSVFVRKWSHGQLVILDQILDDPDNFRLVTSPAHFLSLSVAGMRVAHPVCVSWNFFKLGADMWPLEPRVWLFFAKFVAVYPEETQTLTWIHHMIVSEKLHGVTIRTIKEQVVVISHERESNLSPLLKSRLNSLGKRTQRSKHKLRHVWDVVIQGNVGEVESATRRFTESVEQNEADFQHLCCTFPNNRFVTRAYARFLSELRADRAGCNDMLEQTRQLQRGLTVNIDHAHELGLKAFPQLPEKLQASAIPPVDAAPSMSSDNDAADDDAQLDTEEATTISARIETLKVPATRRTRRLQVIAFCALMIVPAIAFEIYAARALEKVQSPLRYIYYLSMTRAAVSQLAAFSHRYIMEQLNRTVEFANTYPAPTTLGNSWDTKVQLLAVIKAATSSIQESTGLRTLAAEGSALARAEEQIFQPIFEYVSFASGQAETSSITVQASIMDFIVQLAPISTVLNATQPTDVTPAMVNEPIVTNLLENADFISETINTALAALSEFVLSSDEEARLVSNFFFYAMIGVSAIVYFTLLVLQVRWIKVNKEEAYLCLTCLPKNTVSQLAENLRVLKKGAAADAGTTDTSAESNKQDENIVRVFNNGGSNESKLSDLLLFIAPVVVGFGLTIALGFALTNMLVVACYHVQQGAPHLDNLLGSYSTILGTYFSLAHLLNYGTPFWTATAVPQDHLIDADDKMRLSRDYWHKVRFGGRGADEMPFSGFADILARAQPAFKIACPDAAIVFADFNDARRCMPTDLEFVLLEPSMRSRIEEFVEGRPGALAATTDPVYTTLWKMMIEPLYEELFMPMFDSIVVTIQTQVHDQQTGVIPLIVIFIVLGAICQGVVFWHCYEIEAHIHSVLKLLLHVSPDVVTGTPKIMSVLAGDFDAAKSTVGNRDAQFFDTIFTSLPDAVMFGSLADQLVEGASESCGKMFGTDDIVGRPIADFYNVDRFHGDVNGLFVGSVTTTLMMTVDGSDTYYDVTSVISNERIVLTARDATQTVRYNTLIAEERSKSDALLSSILPPSLVGRVQAGEKNISFAVQSASISFIDIVEFTPWCGSLPAATVMATLNLLFKKFDDRLGRRATLTKIKCIGDCYMSAGGIFSELNQPAVHSKDMVSFGLDAIAALQELNGEVHQTLRIRVGVNSGGPIVAGVLGVGKPTFEILGPAINMAQQMEHHGVPMLVHVSRAVYELIYGDIFQIKERGETEINTGKVVTYLVSPKA